MRIFVLLCAILSLMRLRLCGQPDRWAGNARPCPILLGPRKLEDHPPLCELSSLPPMPVEGFFQDHAGRCGGNREWNEGGVPWHGCLTSIPMFCPSKSIPESVQIPRRKDRNGS